MRARSLWLGLAAVVAAAVLLLAVTIAAHAPAAAPASAAEPGTWSYTGSLAAPRAGHTATKLGDGRVVVIGGYFSYFNGVHTDIEVYDPAAGTFSSAGSLNTGRFWHAATLLPDGRVLVTGGDDSTGAALSTAEVYDPATGSSTFAANNMSAARARHTATLLPNGKVLIAGTGFPGDLSVTADLYDPGTDTFSATGPMTFLRFAHSATLLLDGKVLVAGGCCGEETGRSAEVYDPTTGVFTRGGDLTGSRHSHTATLLADGQILITGGVDFNTLSPSQSAELFSPSTNSFSLTAPMSTPRAEHAAALLPDGDVLISGGLISPAPFTFECTPTAEIFRLATNDFVSAAQMNESQTVDRRSVPLDDGRILVVGGTCDPLAGITSSAELFTRVLPPDTDGDGVPDASDECPNTPLGETVDAYGCSQRQNEDLVARKFAPAIELAGDDYKPEDVRIMVESELRPGAGAEAMLWFSIPLLPDFLVASNPTLSSLCLLANSPNLYLDLNVDQPDPTATGTLDQVSYLNWYGSIESYYPDTVYARVKIPPVAGDPVAVQYWFFYYFNDWKNNHEADWEQITLVFPQGKAISEIAHGDIKPERAGYSQHGHGTREDWPYLESIGEIKDGSHPKVHVGRGSHANYFRAGKYRHFNSLFVGLIGIDDARGTVEIAYGQPSLLDAAGTCDQGGWLNYQGRWGQLLTTGMTGPQGPKFENQQMWNEPASWVNSLLDDSALWVRCSLLTRLVNCRAP